MMAYVLRCWSRWMERRGLTAVATVVDARRAAGGDVAAMHDLARRALKERRPQVAVEQLQQAVQYDPEDAGLWCTLGAAHRHGGDFAASRAAYERALQLRPAYPQVLSNLGEWCLVQDQCGEALLWFDRALALDGDLFEAQVNKTAALFELGRFGEALVLAEHLVAAHPGRAEARLNLGNVLLHTGKGRQAIRCYKKALELEPKYEEASYNLAALLGSRWDMANAIGYLERRIAERGDSVHNLGLLASARQAAGQLAAAEQLCRDILVRQPENLTALLTLGSCQSNGGDATAALATYEEVLSIDAAQWTVASNALFELNYVAGLERAHVFERHCRWAQTFAAPPLLADDYAARDRDPGRKLRIGYVSGDFTRHPVGFLLSDILRHHDAEGYSVHCFSMLLRPDDALPELRAAADSWHDVIDLGDDELEQLVRDEEIDILIDLSGHTALHRLPVFARRPAPVQVEWIGYFHSTGMSTIDYFITDPSTSPAGSDQLFSETPVYLPHTRFCYGPPSYAPAVAESPVSKGHRLTFGSFNRLAKITDVVVAAWAEVLLAVPDSRLLIKSAAFSEELVRQRLTARFERCGVRAERLELRENSPHEEMLAEYADVDIALDTFPFNGGMTTLEALWMGVPVVTIAGNTVVSRQTVSVLANIGLDGELAFPDRAAYVAGAVALAADGERLARLRRTLRPTMEQSPLRRSEEFAHDLEMLYRRMWHAWCAGGKLASDLAPGARGN